MIVLYFHCTDGIETLMDDRGHVFTGLGSGSVRGMALARIRELVEASDDTTDWTRWRCEVADADGDVILSVRFDQVVSLELGTTPLDHEWTQAPRAASE